MSWIVGVSLVARDGVSKGDTIHYAGATVKFRAQTPGWIIILPDPLALRAAGRPCQQEETMRNFPSNLGFCVSLAVIAALPASAADIIVSAQDGKFVRDAGRATFPQPAPPDSLVVIDASRTPPVVKGTLEGIEHTVQGPPQA